MKLPGARIVLECLKREGVEIVFGLPGGAVLPIYDALYDFEGLRHVLVRQEAAAGHAAEGYARATGKVGVCLVTSGPACTNLVTALQDAMMDSIPIVAFTGQVPTHLIGNDAFQEADNVGITRSCTKHNFLVKDGKDLGPIIREAFHIAATGRPGPVHVDLPKDIPVKEAELTWPEKVVMRSYNPNYDGHPGQVKRAARAMVHLVGGKWGRVLLLEYVFLEVVTVLLARRGHPTAVAVGNTLLQAAEVDFIPCSELFLDALDVFQSQKSGVLSFVDAAIVAAAQTRADGHIATFDRDFSDVPGLTLVPA